MARKRKGDAVHGWVNLDKPYGLGSTSAVGKTRWLFNANKAGHAGTLDPLATGVLPIALGDATKTVPFLVEADKTYVFTAKWGERTSTLDAEGEVVATSDVRPKDNDIMAILPSFTGEIEQTPPIYSAIKIDGMRAYDLARAGVDVEMKSRSTTIHELVLLSCAEDEATFETRCSKGTYIRTLVEDIAKVAGTVAHTAKLHRETVGDFRAEDMVDLAGAVEAAESDPESLRERLLPADVALAGWPACRVVTEDVERFSGGQQVACDSDGAGLIKVYGPDERFLGVGELTGGNNVAPKRIFMLAG